MASSRSRSYRRTHSQRLSSSGSRSGSPAFIGKSVLGRNSVLLQSRPICGGRGFATASRGIAFARAPAIGFAFVLTDSGLVALAPRAAADFADGLRAVVAFATFGLAAGLLAPFAAGFTFVTGAFALADGLAARF